MIVPGSAPELALPLVVRIERADPPSRTDALEAAVRAVLTMLTSEEPDWQDAIRALREVLASTTIAQLAEREADARGSGAMYYI